MKSSRRGRLVKHLTETELDHAIEGAQKADEIRLIRRLCFVKNLYQDDTRIEAGNHLRISRSTTHRWANAWNDGGVEELCPRFGGGRPQKLIPQQWTDVCVALEDGQPWTPKQIHALIEDRYHVTCHPAHLSRKLREAGMNYAKPRPMDPRQPDDADEILAERLAQALGEDTHEEEVEEEPSVLGFFR